MDGSSSTYEKLVMCVQISSENPEEGYRWKSLAQIVLSIYIYPANCIWTRVLN